MGSTIRQLSAKSKCFSDFKEVHYPPFNATPLSKQVMENHQRGVVSVAWCQRDPDLLLSCGKDNRVICWNPNATPPEVSVMYFAYFHILTDCSLISLKIISSILFPEAFETINVYPLYHV